MSKTKHLQKRGEADEGREVIVEPIRRSIYDVLVTNLKLAKRVTYIHRLIYIGEHDYRETDEKFDEAMAKNYKLTNTGYTTEPLSGILLHYASHFCYIVEGSEEVLHKHLTLLLEQESKHLSNVRVLSAIHHVKSRFWSDWMSYMGRPPERVEIFDSESDLETSMRYVTECCEKLYKFANAILADQLKLRAAAQGEKDSEEEEEFVPKPKERARSIVERDTYADLLPEIKLLQFLNKCKHLKTLDEYHRYYEYVGQSYDYSLKSWPAPKNFVPYDVFDAPFNPISDLPVKEEGSHHSEESVSEVTTAESTLAGSHAPSVDMGNAEPAT